MKKLYVVDYNCIEVYEIIKETNKTYTTSERVYRKTLRKSLLNVFEDKQKAISYFINISEDKIKSYERQIENLRNNLKNIDLKTNQK